MIHAHITAWFLALILFFVAISLHKSGKVKAFKIVQMILRVLYLLIIATGAGLLFTVYKIDVWYILKAVVGLWVIGIFEMLLGRIANNRKTSVFWIQFVVAWLLVLYLGFVKLPMSFLNP
ncbi:YisL family protein [Neobacillus dielmonensis]|uniref:YisL family protein n=1 Tax=Neobacillus dielmonensis TaxID=1347369 RepID=UPI0005A7C91D|nr:YisL family protein [Neobacillus dielmonensis]